MSAPGNFEDVGGGFSGASNDATLVATGPINVWVRFVEAFATNPFSSNTFTGQIYYVGTCEKWPVCETDSSYVPYYSSIGGSEKPTDKFYGGVSEIIVLDLTRFNPAVIDMMSAAPRYGRSIDSLQYRNAVNSEQTSQGTVPIINRRLDRGSLLIRNKGFYQIWLQYTFADTTNAVAALPLGEFFYCCSTASAYIPRQGSVNQMRRLIIEAMELQDSNGYMWGLKTNTEDVFVPLQNLTPG